MFLKDDIGETDDVQWTDPPIQVHYYANHNDCLDEENIDINVISPSRALDFISVAPGEYKIPRGKDLESVFYEPLYSITYGQDQIPRSIVFEADTFENSSCMKIGELYTYLANIITKMLGKCIVSIHRVELPLRLSSIWAVIPGENIDPAIMVKYHAV